MKDKYIPIESFGIFKHPTKNRWVVASIVSQGQDVVAVNLSDPMSKKWATHLLQTLTQTAGENA